MITLYHSVASRSVIPLWMLEELGVAYEIADTDIRARKHKTPEFLKINPMGKVPALRDGETIVTEGPAICLYLADRYSYGTLAPKIDEPARGPFVKWIVFANAVFEPAAWLPAPVTEADRSGYGWGHPQKVFDTLEAALTPGPWLLGDRFSAADVALGGLFGIAWFNKKVPERPAFAAYFDRINARPAYQRAANRTWPPDLFKS
ncbi:MAG TPA: glutathione S-transferase family protein [Rhizomicrobium sp.]|nr:glutathione S-transferase family protein [Rhizomicrobium sp.]